MFASRKPPGSLLGPAPEEKRLPKPGFKRKIEDVLRDGQNEDAKTPFDRLIWTTYRRG
jgi:hypothetical protein